MTKHYTFTTLPYNNTDSDLGDLDILINEVSLHWESIGKELGLPFELSESMKVQYETDLERMEIIWKMWLDQDQDLSNVDKYSPNLIGLNEILSHIQKNMKQQSE